MLNTLSLILSGLCLATGSFFVFAGGIGALRFPDFFSRLHAGSITDSLGGGLILLGLMFLAGPTLISAKLLLIIAVIGLTSPTASHSLAKAALHGKLIPIGAPNDIALVGDHAKTQNLSNKSQASFDAVTKHQAATAPVLDGEILKEDGAVSDTSSVSSKKESIDVD